MPTSSSTPSLLLQDARIVGPDHVTEHGSILVENGRIARLLDFQAEPSPVESVLNLQGLTLFPGFIDLHIHGAVGVDTMEADAEALERASVFLLTQGVTGWLPTLVPAPAEQYRQSVGAIASLISRQRDEQEQSAPTQARALGVHYEGPFVNGEQCGALHRDHFRTFSRQAELDDLAVIANPDAVHMMTLAPEIDGGIELVRELSKRGWVVSIGHTRADVELLDRACEAGARHLTHFMNAMAPLHHRAPGPIGWGLLRDDVTCDLIADGIHLDRLTLKLLQKLKTPARLLLISDAIAAAGLGDGDYQIWGETISVFGGRTQNSSGSIAGSVISMLDAVKMMRSLGVGEIDLARMAATNPARLLRVDKDCGSIEAGKRADLVGLDQDGNVRFTMVGGKSSTSLA